MGNALLLALVLPAAAGAVCWALGRRGGRGALWLALLAAVATAAVAGRLAVAQGAVLDRPWLNVSGFSLPIVLRTAPMGALGAAAAAGFAVLILLYSVGYVSGAADTGRYAAYVLWALAGALATFYADHLLVLLIGWETVTLMLFLLVNLGGTEAAARGAMKSFVMVGLADAAMLAAVAFLWASGAMPHLLLSEVPPGGLAIAGPALRPFGYLAYMLLLAGALGKAGAVPLHTWLPAAAEGAPASVMAFLPAALDKLLGIYLLALISLRLFAVDAIVQTLLLIVGAVTVITAVMMAMVQHDLKRLLSFHAVSQVGYMVLGIGTGTWLGIVGGLFHLLNNAVYKCCLFLTAGAVEKRTGTTDLDRLGGLGRAMPATFLACTVAALAISGVPPLNGFASKWMVYQGLLATGTRLGPLALVAAMFGSALTLASFVKVLHSVFAGPVSSHAAARGPREVGPAMATPMLLLAAVCVVFGLHYGLPTQRWLAPALAAWGVRALAAEVGALWRPLPALGLLALALLAGGLLYASGRAFSARRTRPFVCGEVLPAEPLRVSGTGFYGTVRDLPMVGAVYRDAERGALDVYRWGGRYGATLVEALRSLHSGALPVYVSWCLLGLMVVVAFLIQRGG